MTKPVIRNKRHLIEHLIEAAFVRGHMIGSPESYAAKKLVDSGGEWPDRLKPGALIQELPAEHREMLKGLTPADLDHRPDSIVFAPRR